MGSIKLQEGTGLDEYPLCFCEVDEDVALLPRRPQIAAGEHGRSLWFGLAGEELKVLVVILAASLLFLDASFDVLIFLDDLLV